MQKFQELFDLVLKYSMQYAEMTSSLMKMLYLFLFAKVKVVSKRQETTQAAEDTP